MTRDELIKYLTDSENDGEVFVWVNGDRFPIISIDDTMPENTIDINITE